MDSILESLKLQRCFFALWQNESAETATSSSGAAKEADFDNKIETDRGKRFDYLLKQTEIFTHFMTNSTKSPPKNKGRPKKKDKDSEKEKDLNTSGSAE